MFALKGKSYYKFYEHTRGFHFDKTKTKLLYPTRVDVMLDPLIVYSKKLQAQKKNLSKSNLRKII